MPPAQNSDAAAPVSAAPASPLALFLAFAGLSLQSFGGAIALIERTVVQRKRWLTGDEFVGLYAISQVLPGPTGISFCVLLGDRFFGLKGAVATVAGFILPPAVIVLSITALFQQFHHVPQVQGALHGMGAAAVGVIAATVMRLGRTLRGKSSAMLAAALAFIAVALGRIPVSWVVLTIGVLSVVWTWRRLGR